MFPEGITIEHELEEGVHFDGVLGEDEAAVVLEGELLQAEEGEVAEDLVEHVVVAVSRRREPLEEDRVEHLQELLVPDATVEDLLDKDLLVRVLELYDSG